MYKTIFIDQGVVAQVKRKWLWKKIQHAKKILSFRVLADVKVTLVNLLFFIANQVKLCYQKNAVEVSKINRVPCDGV